MGQDSDSLRDSSNATNTPRLIDRFRAAIRSRHYSRRTEKTYWLRRSLVASCPVAQVPTRAIRVGLAEQRIAEYRVA
jgi:hypothetical protein